MVQLQAELMAAALSPPRVKVLQARGIYVTDLMGNGAEIVVVQITAKLGYRGIAASLSRCWQL